MIPWIYCDSAGYLPNGNLSVLIASGLFGTGVCFNHFIHLHIWNYVFLGICFNKFREFSHIPSSAPEWRLL